MTAGAVRRIRYFKAGQCRQGKQGEDHQASPTRHHPLRAPAPAAATAEVLGAVDGKQRAATRLFGSPWIVLKRQRGDLCRATELQESRVRGDLRAGLYGGATGCSRTPSNRLQRMWGHC